MELMSEGCFIHRSGTFIRIYHGLTQAGVFLPIIDWNHSGALWVFICLACAAVYLWQEVLLGTREAMFARTISMFSSLWWFGA
jgi:hypothetical protein